MIKKIAISILVTIVFKNFCYASDKYTIADSYLKSGEYELAADEYQKILEVNGPASLSTDIHAMIGSIIALYKIGNFKQSFLLCKRVLQLHAYNSTAIFYAGLNLEAMEDDKLAKKLFNYFEFVDSDDPFRYLIKARYDLIHEKEILNDINTAIEMEDRVANQTLPDNSVAVLYFTNDSYDQSWNILGKGFSQLLIDDLSKIKNIDVVERIEVQRLSEKLNIAPSEFNNENFIPRFSRLLMAKYVVNGIFSISTEKNINFYVGIMNAVQPNVIDQMEYSGKTKDIFTLEKKIISQILTKMEISITEDEQKKLNKYQTKNFDAFLSYCRGLDLLDYGNTDGAYTNFALALKLDHNFLLAKDIKATIDAFMMMENEDIALKHFDIMGKRSFGTSSENQASSSLAKARINNVLLNLDLGYLPGNDARKSTDEYNPSHLLLERRILKEPPPPPSN